MKRSSAPSVQVATASDIPGPEPIPYSYQIASWILAGIALAAMLALHLVAVLIAGLLVFHIVHWLAGAVRVPQVHNQRVKIFIVALLALLVVGGLVLGVIGIAHFLSSDPDSISGLLSRIAATVHDLRRIVPPSIAEYLPADSADFEGSIATWLREHANEIGTAGKDTVRALLHVLIGSILGAMIALYERVPHGEARPFVRALLQRTELLASAFRKIMLAQVPISAINTALTAVYLAIALPAFGVNLPFAKTLIALTFVAGLLPVVGNLISNTAIVLISVGQSLGLGAASLVFLVIVHKLEYFLNARIVGTHIHARPWELLIAMLVLESAFGAVGLVAAPLFYAYVKLELMEQRLV